MDEKTSTAQLEKDLTEKLRVSTDDQEPPSNQPQSATPNLKQKRRQKKKAPKDQNNLAEATKETAGASNLEKNSIQHNNKEDPTKKQRWTKEFAAWEIQRKQMMKQGTLSSVCLYPEPQKFVEEDHRKRTSPKSSFGKPEVLEPRSNTPAKECATPQETNLESGACRVDEPHVKEVTILKNPSRDAELEPNAQQNPLSQEDNSLLLKESDAADQAASSNLKTAQQDKSKPKPYAQKAPEEYSIPEGHIQLVIKSAPPPQPKRKREAAKPTEKTEEAGEARTESPQTSSEEEEPKKPLPQRVLKVIVEKTALARYRRCGILPLKQINEKFPRAFFHCRLCSMHLSTLPETERHLRDSRHSRLLVLEQKKQTAALMPMPTQEIVDVIEELVQNLYECSRIDEKDLEIRLAAFSYLQKMIENVFPGYSIRLYGSTFTGFGLKDSDVNVSLVFVEPKDEPISRLMIINIFNWLQTNPIWIKVVEDFNCRVPIIRFTHQQLNVSFSLVIEEESSYKTGVLFKEYQQLDSRFAVLTVAFRTFARICGLDKPDFGSLPSHAFNLMVLHYLQQVKVLPVLHSSIESETYKSAEEFKQNIEAGKWKPASKTLGSLWLGMLQYYACKFHYEAYVVCVRSVGMLKRATKNWGNRRLTIEDPFHTNVNVASSMTTTQTFEFFLDCMRNLFAFFWIPQTASGPLFTQLVLPGEGADGGGLTPYEAKKKMNELKKEDLKWDFTPAKILGSAKLPLTCTVCNVDGHSKHNCKELEVPPVGHFPPLEYSYLVVLDQICYNIFRNFSQSQKHISIRESIRQELEQYIRQEYPDAVLTLFGSSCNGFGFFDSDMDVCMTFQSNADGKDVDFGAIIKKLGRMMRKNRTLTDIIPITSAKVPIVKMRHRAARLEADISLYNTLGRRNTQLLATYAAIDPRVRTLGYMAKLLAKQCDIGDASRGTLSSYAYTLMVIFYLQQIDPPVIPVLQDIVIEEVDRSKYIVEGRDTWFFEDLPNLYRVWPHGGANRDSPSLLWLGFLRYYAEIFNYERQVVCIRQLKPLFRLEKMWTERFVAIEDPFDLSHNLGSGLSFRMGAYIRKVFAFALRVFHTPIRTLPRGYTCLEEYLFNPQVLAPGVPPPNERGCNICGRIGHKVRDCDRKRSNRNRRQDEDEGSEDEAKDRARPVPQQEENRNGMRQPVAPPRIQHHPTPRPRHQGPPVRHNNQPVHYANRQRSVPRYPRAGPPNHAAPAPHKAP